MTTPVSNVIISAVDAQPFSIFQNTITLSKFLAFLDKLLRRCGIELKHIVMTRHDQCRSDIMCQLRRFSAVQISCNPPFWRAAVDRQ